MIAIAVALGVTLAGAVPAVAADPDWTRRIRTSELDSADGVASDGTGIIVVGATRGSLHAPNRGGDDAYIRWYDHDGNLLWGRQFGSTGFDGAADADVSTHGIAVVGQIDGLGYVRRYDRAGRLIWSRRLILPGPRAVAISGNAIYTVGQARDSEHHLVDVYVRRYHLDGTMAWTRSVRGVEDEYATDVAVDPAGVTLLWYSSGGWDAPVPTWDFAIRRYDLSGRQLWTHRLGDGPDGEPRKFGSAIAADASGITVAGGTYGRERSNGQPDARVWRYARDGRQQWIRTFGGAYGGAASAVDADGSGISVVGWLARGPSDDDSRSGFLRRYSFSGEAQWTEHLPVSGYSQTDGVAAGGGADVIAGTIPLYVDGEYDWDGWIRRYVR